MLEWLKSTWTKWKVHVSVVGGVLVIATAYGNCTVEPPSVSDATTITDEVSTTDEAVEVSAITEGIEETPVTDIPATTIE